MGTREKKLSDRQEKDIANWWPNAQQTISSGNKYEKLDVQVERDDTSWQFLIECKETQNKGYRLERELWEYISQRTYERSGDMRPCLAIRFYSSNIVEEPVRHEVPVEKVKVLTDIAVVELSDLIELVEELQTLRSKLKELNGNS